MYILHPIGNPIGMFVLHTKSYINLKTGSRHLHIRVCVRLCSYLEHVSLVDRETCDHARRQLACVEPLYARYVGDSRLKNNVRPQLRHWGSIVTRHSSFLRANTVRSIFGICSVCSVCVECREDSSPRTRCRWLPAQEAGPGRSWHPYTLTAPSPSHPHAPTPVEYAGYR